MNFDVILFNYLLKVKLSQKITTVTKIFIKIIYCGQAIPHLITVLSAMDSEQVAHELVFKQQQVKAIFCLLLGSLSYISMNFVTVNVW